MAPLTQDKLLELQQAVIRARLEDRREGLLTTIDRRVVAQLPRVAHPDAQILEDLDYLNGIGAIDDGTYPFETWLKNAAALAAPRQEARLFREVLEGLYGAFAINHLLVVRGGPHDGKRVYLSEGTERVVGRGRRADLAFTEDRTLSSSHAKLGAHDHALRVRDLGSRNGVWLNEHRVAHALLAIGDELRCGETVLVVMDVATPNTDPSPRLRALSLPLEI